MRPIRVNDIRFTEFGDLVLDDDGDFEDTKKSHPFLSFVQECKNRIRSDLNDWKLHPHLGASLTDLQGEPNNRQTAETGKARIISALTKDALVAANLINVRYMPISQHHLYYTVKISLPGTSEDEIISLSLLMDTSEFEVLFL